MGLSPRAIALAALAACGKADEARPIAVASSAEAPRSDARSAVDVPLADGALVRRDEQAAILRALQGTWRFDWHRSDSPPDAKDTIWHVAGDAVTVVDGSRTRHGTLRVLAPCLMRLYGVDGEQPYVAFLVEPDGVRLYVDAIGRRTDGGWIACSELGHVYTVRGDRCTMTSYEWRTETVETAAVRCEHGRLDGHEAWTFHAAADWHDDLFVVGDELRGTLVERSPPMRAE